MIAASGLVLSYVRTPFQLEGISEHLKRTALDLVHRDRLPHAIDIVDADPGLPGLGIDGRTGEQSLLLQGTQDIRPALGDRLADKLESI